VGRICRKGRFFSLEWKRIERVKDDESGESMEPMEEVPRIWLGEDLQSVYYVAERALTSSFFEDFRSFARHIRASYLLSPRRANVNTLSSNLSIFISHEGHKIFNINKIASDFNSLSLLEPFTGIYISKIMSVTVAKYLHKLHCVSKNFTPSCLRNISVDPKSISIIFGSIAQKKNTIRYDTRCYYNVRSKADMSRFNLPHGDDN